MTRSVQTVPAPRILIVRVGAMGDILHALPAVAALRSALPGAVLGWAVEPRWRDLLASPQGSPLLDHLYLVPTRVWKQRPLSVATLREIAGLRRAMHAGRYDLCVDLQGSIKSAAIGRLSGALRLAGPRRPRERQARALYTERIETHAGHVIDQGCELLGAAAGVSLKPAAAPLPCDPEAERWATALARSGTVLLAPTAGWGAKQWPATHFAELARRLTERGHPVLVNAAGPDDVVAHQVARAAGVQAVPCTVAQLIALTRRAGLVVGGDTGPIHLAAAMGRPVVALFGPTDPARNGPFFPGANVRVVRDGASRLSHKRTDQTDPGLARITVEQVLGEAETLLATELLHA